MRRAWRLHYLRRMACLFPGTKSGERHGRGQLEVEAPATDGAVDNRALEFLELWQVLVHNVGDLHERLRGGLATAVILPLATVENERARERK